MREFYYAPFDVKYQDSILLKILIIHSICLHNVYRTNNFNNLISIYQYIYILIGLLIVHCLLCKVIAVIILKVSALG